MRARTDLHDPRSFDHVGRDAAATLVPGRVVTEMAAEDPRIVCATADLTYVTHFGTFAHRYPERFFQFGISERNMISAAAGLATCGYRPYAVTFSCFSAILGYEGIRTDLAYPNLPVRLLGTHTGISMGFFGTSHHATEDIAALRAVANLTIVCPADPLTTEALLRQTVDLAGPVYYRLGRGREPVVYQELPEDFAFGRPQQVVAGDDVLICATGMTVAVAADAAHELRQRHGVDAAVLDVHTLKPFPSAAVADAARGKRLVVTVEEHNVEGGLGTLVREALADHRMPVPVYKHGLYDEYAIIGPPTHLYRYYGLTPEGVTTVVRRALDDGAGPIRPLWTEHDRDRVMRECNRRTE